MSDKHSLAITLCDLQTELVRAWERAFAKEESVEVVEGDLTEVYADAYVSPANSYGYMDGGVDLALRERFAAFDIERRVQEQIAEIGGLLPVGEAIVVETGDDEVPFLISAATMEFPSHVGDTNNAYRAMRALLCAVEAHNAERSESITSLGIPGLCTGVGGMAAERAARQMHLAYTEWREST
jgi:O-acetyl-ADP-ribose deacetylase (regulator of RNase III)